MNRNEDMFVNAGGSRPTHAQEQNVAPTVDSSSQKSIRERHKDALFKIGAVEIFTGVLSIILGASILIIASSDRGHSAFGLRFFDFQYRNHHYTDPGLGIWCGLFATVVGILGVRARSLPSKCIYNANVALSIVGAIVMGLLMFLSGMAAVSSLPSVSRLTIIHFILVFLGFIGMILMIIHSAYGCAGIRSKRASYQRVAVSYQQQQPVGMQQPHLIQLANGQYLLAPTQMMVAPYSVVQVPVVEAPTPYHPPPGYSHDPSLPPYQYYHGSSLQTQMVSAAAPINEDPPQATAAGATQQTAASNPHQAAQAAKGLEAIGDPPEYSTLPRNK